MSTQFAPVSIETRNQHRLARLPERTAAPLRQLLSLGQLSDDTVSILLDAADLSRDPAKLLGFAAGYLHMRSQSIPVHDVIAMAKSQKRHINLAWSPNRWKDEHHRLSRAEALIRMAGQNVHYDVSAYEQHLPPRFPGTLIRSSRRLGMEGLRQRHCVASYHDRLEAGTSAIASVILDRQRWTVELKLTNDPQDPIRIVQIKTRYNELPTAHTRECIHAALDIAIPKPEIRPDNGARSHLYLENLRRILPVLRDASIEAVTVEFDGGGDSGAIEGIYCTPGHLDPLLDTLTAEHLSTQSFLDDGQWTSGLTPEIAPLRTIIDTLTYDYLSETSVDWYNNDGGYGSLQIDVGQGTVELSVYVRYTESSNEHSSLVDIESGEDI